MTYSRARGRVGAYMRGSPDGMRPEPGRGAATIDDPYTDGVSITAWTPEGRKHLATYTVGLSYSNRDFSYYLSGNCLCHAGTELGPDWLGENYFCDSALRCDDVCTTAEECDAACGAGGENGNRQFINGESGRQCRRKGKGRGRRPFRPPGLTGVRWTRGR